MPSKHGNKIYKQILLDPGMYILLEKLAGDQKKVSSLIRKVVYEWIETQVDKSEFQAAKALDDALWQQSILNRIDGRKKNNQKSIIDSSKNEKIKSYEKKENNFQYLIDPEIMIKNLKNIIKKDR